MCVCVRMFVYLIINLFVIEIFRICKWTKWMKRILFFYKLFVLKQDYFSLEFFLRLEYYLRVILSVNGNFVKEILEKLILSKKIIFSKFEREKKACHLSF